MLNQRRAVLALALVSSACFSERTVEMSVEPTYSYDIEWEGAWNPSPRPDLFISAEDPRVDLLVIYPRRYALELDRVLLMTCEGQKALFDGEHRYRAGRHDAWRLHARDSLPNHRCETKLRITATFTPKLGKRPPLTITRLFTTILDGHVGTGL
jgi:hypothetical protein